CPGRGEDGQPSAQHGRRPVSAAERPDRTHGTHGKGSGVARQLAGRPRVIIAGAGFGGITCARALKRVDVDVLLIDRNNYHLFTPLLYQVASALLDPGEIARPVRELVRPLRNVEFRQAEITGADLQRRLLLTDHGPIPYDFLVLATGAQTDFFGNESVARNAFEPELRAAAKRSLESKGVEVKLGARVAEINKDVIQLAGGGEIQAGTVIWTAGVRASEVGATLGVEVGKQWRVKVAPTLQVPGHPAAFVIGDLAAATDGETLLPMLIPVAMQEAKQVARTIADMVHNGGASTFCYRDPGIMATIGRNSGVAQLGPVHLS